MGKSYKNVGDKQIPKLFTVILQGVQLKDLSRVSGFVPSGQVDFPAASTRGFHFLEMFEISHSSNFIFIRKTNVMFMQQ